MSTNKFLLLIHTLRHLKPSQFLWRLRFHFINSSTKLDDADHPTLISFHLAQACNRPNSYLDNNFHFLNHIVNYHVLVNWDDSDQSKLWLYNLHYFDYLQQPAINQQTCVGIINQWINSNSPFDGNGWEPYPLSLRIVNWIKFIEKANLNKSSSKTILHSLFLQARSLRNQLEFHLLGNHLFKNAVALLYVGYFFSGKEADEWYEKGKTILVNQLDEQVLVDGGHFERSPMYHALILEDILDCLNLVQSNQHLNNVEFEKLLKSKAISMLGFLEDIVHPDGTLPVFNDTAQGIASTPEQLFSYARRLNLQWQKNPGNLIEKNDFGVFLLKNNRINCIIDAGKIGPDYLPGHAHCDTLSYELSVNGNRIVVNAGVFQYAGEERNVYRATRSHNTVEIDNAEQHEIWSTFRVARRGYPRNVSVKCDNEELIFSGQHTGYQRLKGKPVHQRDVQISANEMKVVDRVIGKGKHSAKCFIHFHPQVEIIEKLQNQLKLRRDDSVFVLKIPETLDWALDAYEYSAEFGLKEKSNLVTITTNGSDDFSFSYSFEVN